jgi:hypothetical protein
MRAALIRDSEGGEMMRKIPAIFLALIGSSFVATSTAHHSAVSLYDLTASITIEGTVTEYQFVTPHARIFLDVLGADGQIQKWMAEGANAVALRHRGWTGDEIKIGDRIVIVGIPSRDGSFRTEWTEIQLPDGRSLGGGNRFPKEQDELLDRLERERRSNSAVE